MVAGTPCCWRRSQKDNVMALLWSTICMEGHALIMGLEEAREALAQEKARKEVAQKER